jgi:hypothetical protein
MTAHYGYLNQTYAQEDGGLISLRVRVAAATLQKSIRGCAESAPFFSTKNMSNIDSVVYHLIVLSQCTYETSFA